MQITNVTMKNFLSVGNVTQAVKLDKNGLTLVLGSNTDSNGGTTRNGAGKTTILQAISYGLYGKPLTRIKVGNLVNNINNKAMMVSVEFTTDSKTYRIERGQKPAFLKFFVNDKEVDGDEEGDEAQGENRHTQEEIDRLIGMSHTMFKHIVALNTFTDPFLKMSVGDQRQVIEELLGITQISQRAEILKKQINVTKEALRDEESYIKATTEANSRIEIAISQAQSNSVAWSNARDNNIETIKSEIEAVSSIDFDAELDAFDRLDAYRVEERDLKTSLEAIEISISEADSLYQRYADDAARAMTQADNMSVTDQIARLRKEITRKEGEITKAGKRINESTMKCEEVEDNLARPDDQICVCCNQKLSNTDHLKTVIANLTEQRDSLKAGIAKETTLIETIKAEIEAIETEIVTVQSDLDSRIAEKMSESQDLAEQASQFLTTKEKHEATKADIVSRLDELGEAPPTTFNSRDEVYKAKQLFDALSRDLENEVNKDNPFVSQVDNLKSTLQPVDYDLINQLTDLMKHQDFLLKLLTNKDSFIRKRIIDQNLAYLNSRLNYYLDKLGLPHEVRFLSDLSVEIVLLGRDFDFEQLSRGEMNRVIMATSWSFRDVWESLNQTINLLWVDEMLDQGTDGQGVEAAISILKTMSRNGKNVFLISHRDELISRIDNILLVQKDSGFTRFQDEVGIESITP
jgi:DNA repair exonuclease SbcCD ATPase subunit